MTASSDRAPAGIPLVVVDVTGYGRPDLVLVDLLTRVRLVAGRLGARVEVRGAGAELAQLLELVGLLAVVPVDVDPHPDPQRSASEVRRQTEPLE